MGVTAPAPRADESGPPPRLHFAVHALSRFAVSERGARSGLVLGFGAITLDRIDEGLGRLRDSLDGPTTRVPGSAGP
jgi:hypothetical protein